MPIASAAEAARGARGLGGITAPTTPQVLYDPRTNNIFVNGFEFNADDADSLLKSKQYLKAPPKAPPSGGAWRTMSPREYGGLYKRVKDPSLGARLTGSFKSGVGGAKEIYGAALQFAGAEETGAGIRERGAEQARFNAPYNAALSDIGKPNVGILDFAASTIGQLGPFALESAAVSLAGALAGAGTSALAGPAAPVAAPFTAAGGALAGLVGKAGIKKALLSAARKQTAGEALDATEEALLRQYAVDNGGAQLAKEVVDGPVATAALSQHPSYAKDYAKDIVADATRAQAADGARLATTAGTKQAAVGGAGVASGVNNTGIGVGDVYGEGIDTGTESRAAALLGGVLYGAIGTAPELLLGARVLNLIRTSGTQGVARSVATGAGVGTVSEGLSEAGQEAIVLGATNQLSDPGVGTRLLDAGAAGALAGGLLGGGAGIRPAPPISSTEPVSLLEPRAQENPDPLISADTAFPTQVFNSYVDGRQVKLSATPASRRISAFKSLVKRQPPEDDPTVAGAGRAMVDILAGTDEVAKKELLDYMDKAPAWARDPIRAEATRRNPEGIAAVRAEAEQLSVPDTVPQSVQSEVSGTGVPTAEARVTPPPTVEPTVSGTGIDDPIDVLGSDYIGDESLQEREDREAQVQRIAEREAHLAEVRDFPFPDDNDGTVGELLDADVFPGDFVGQEPPAQEVEPEPTPTPAPIPEPVQDTTPQPFDATTLTDDDKAAIRKLGRGRYNGKGRALSELEIPEVLTRTTPDYKGAMFRGVAGYDVLGGNDKVGDTITFEAPESFSAGQQWAERHTGIGNRDNKTLLVVEDGVGYNLSPISGIYEAEQEVLSPPNTTYRIKEISQVGDTRRVLLEQTEGGQDAISEPSADGVSAEEQTGTVSGDTVGGGTDGRTAGTLTQTQATNPEETSGQAGNIETPAVDTGRSFIDEGQDTSLDLPTGASRDLAGVNVTPFTVWADVQQDLPGANVRNRHGNPASIRELYAGSPGWRRVVESLVNDTTALVAAGKPYDRDGFRTLFLRAFATFWDGAAATRDAISYPDRAIIVRELLENYDGVVAFDKAERAAGKSTRSLADVMLDNLRDFLEGSTREHTKPRKVLATERFPNGLSINQYAREYLMDIDSDGVLGEALEPKTKAITGTARVNRPNKDTAVMADIINGVSLPQKELWQDRVNNLLPKHPDIDYDYVVNGFPLWSYMIGDPKFPGFDGTLQRPILRVIKQTDGRWVPLADSKAVEKDKVATTLADDLTGEGNKAEVIKPERGFNKVSDGKRVIDPLAVGQVDGFMKTALAKIKPEFRPTGSVFRNREDLRTKNPALYERLKAGRPDGEFDRVDAMGYSLGDQVVMFSDNIYTVQQARLTIAHETLGHYGFRAFFSGAELDRLLTDAYDRSGSLRIAAERQMAAGASRLEAIEEVLADQAALLDASVIVKIWGRIKDALNRLGLTFEDDISRYIISRARANLIDGGASLVSYEQIASNIEALKRKTGDGRFTKAFTVDETDAFIAQTGLSLYAGTTLNSMGERLIRISDHIRKNPTSLKGIFRTVTSVFQSMNGRQGKSEGTGRVFRLFHNMQGEAKDIQDEIQKILGDVVGTTLFGVGSGATPKEQTNVGEMAAYATLSAAKRVTDSAIEGAPNPLNAIPTDRGTTYVVDQSAVDTLKAFHNHTRAQLKAGIDVQLGNEIVTKAWPNITDREWAQFKAVRDAVDFTALKELEASANTLNRRSADLMDDVARALGDSTGKRTAIVERAFGFYSSLYNANARFIDGRWTYDDASIRKAGVFLNEFNRGLWVPAKAADWGKIARGETIVSSDKRDDNIKSLNTPEYRAIAQDIAGFWTDGHKALSDTVREQAAYRITKGMNDLYTSDVDLQGIIRNTKRTLMGAYIPLHREGTFEIRLKAYIAGTDRQTAVPEDMKHQLPYMQTASEPDAAVAKKDLDALYTGKVFTITPLDGEPVQIELRAEYGRAPQTAGLEGRVSIAQVTELLNRLDIAIKAPDREKLIKATAAIGDSARKSIERQGTPGWNPDVIKGVAKHLEMKSHVIAKILHSHSIDSILLDDQLWRGDRGKLTALHNAMLEAEKGDNTESIQNAQREYDQYAFQYYNSADKGGRGVKMYRGRGKNRKSKEYQTLGEGELHRDNAKGLLSWYKDVDNVVDGTDELFGKGLAAKLKLAVIVMQLGGNAAVAIHNSSAVVTHAIPYLATYNAKRGYGGGFGFPKAMMAIKSAAGSVGAARFEHSKNIEAIIDGKAPNKTNLTMDELRAMLSATKNGSLQSSQFNAVVGSARSGVKSNRVATAIKGYMFMFTYTEQFTRRTTFLASYRLERDRQLATKQKTEEEARKAAFAFAERAVSDAQGEYSMFNRPSLARGSITQHLFVYKMFPIITLELFASLPRSGQLAMGGILFAGAGLKGLPGAEDLMDLLDTIAQKLGWKISSFEKAAADGFNAIIPGSAPYFMRGGLDQLTGGTHSTGLGLGNLFPLTRVGTADDRHYEEIKDFLGPVYHGVLGLLGTSQQIVKYSAEKAGLFNDNTTLNSIARQSPISGVKAWADAYSYLDTGAITNKRGQIVAPNATVFEAARRMLGLYPARATLGYDVVRIGKQMEAYTKQIKSEFVKSYIVARLAKDNKKVSSVLRDLREWNKNTRGTEFYIRNFQTGANKAYKAAKDSDVKRFLDSRDLTHRPVIKALVEAYGLED